MTIDKYEEFCREQLGLSQNTLKAYRQDLSAFQAFAARELITATPSPNDVLRYQKDLREEQGASPATIRRRLVTLRSYYAWAKAAEPEQSSPFDDLRLDLKVPKRLPRPVDRPTLTTLLRSSRRLVEIEPTSPSPSASGPSASQITGLVTRLLVVTGLRIGELTGLKTRDVSSAASQIRVRGKGNRERTVYVVNQRLRGDFKVYWEYRLRAAGGEGWLFLNSKGNRLTEQTYRKRLRSISKSLDIDPHLTPHRFRHAAATLLIEEGVDIRLVQRLLGHASISTTEVYTKVSDNSLVAAVERADTLGQVDH